MKIYRNVKAHLIFGTLAILLMIWLSDMAGLWNIIVSIIMTISSLIIIFAAYFITRKIPKHDDDIHFHEKDEHAHIRGMK